MADYIFESNDSGFSKPVILCQAGVIIINDVGKILLKHKNETGYWSLLEGNLNSEESLEETTKRGVLEETGLIINELKLFRVYSEKEKEQPFSDEEIYHIYVVYVTTDFSGELYLTDTAQNRLKFFGIEELPININPFHRGYLRDFIDYIYGKTLF